MRAKVLVLFIFLWSTILTWGQTPEYRIRHITNAQGLSNSSVNTVFQDRSGRVWFGTWDGLNRYDGEHIRLFFPSVDNPNTISNNVIREMAQLPDGTIFVATDRGIDSFNPITETFTRYFQDAMGHSPVAEYTFHLATSAQGEVTAVVDGHGIFALEKGVFVRKSPLKARRVRDVFHDLRGKLWMLSDEGEVLCSNSAMVSGVSFLFYDTLEDKIWIQDAGGYRILGEKSSLPVPSAEIRAAASDGTFHYLGTSQGLYRLNIADGSLECLLPDIPVLSVACGIQDIIWVGTDMHGVWQIARRQFDFGAQTGMFGGSAVRCFVQGLSGKLAVGTKGSGIYLFSPDASLCGHLTTKDGLIHNAVYCMKDDGEVIWIGTDGKGLNYQDSRSGRLHKLQAPDSLAISSVYAIQPQGRDTLWVGTSGNGLYRLCLDRTKEPIRVTESYHYTSEQLGSGVVYSLLPTLHGSMFVGTRGAGLQLVRKDSGELSKLRNDIDDDILCLSRGSNGSLWVGTSMGLYRYGQDWEEVTRYSIDNGLPSNTIHGVLEDSNGEMWVSTNSGLARIRRQDGHVNTYHVGDGLQDNEFSDGACYSYGGWFFFGGINGFNAFNPLEVNKDSFMPNLVLDELYIDNERSILPSGKLVLDSGNRSLSFHFVPVDYLSGEESELAYRMRGLSDEWVLLRDSRTVAFSNIPPGNYTLEVRCSNEEGVWSDNWFVQEIHKQSPLWRTPLAKLLYVLIGLALAFYVFYRFRKKASDQAEKQKTEAVHEAKLDFFTNIAHEFSNSLTLIYGPCQALMESARMTGTEQKYLSSIMSNSDRMRNMIQQLITFRKAETGHLRIHIGKVDMIALIAQETSYFREQMERGGVQFRLDSPPEGVIWTADGDSMEKILFNLLSNAVKYTPSNQQIKVSLAVREDVLEMDVTNTGVGIPLEKQAALFDRYEVLTRFEKALAKGRTSNGIGLSLCKSLVELHKGTIDLRSDGSTFTTFHLELPKLPVETDSLYEIKQDEALPAHEVEEIVADEAPETTSAKDLVMVVDDEPEIRSFIRKTLEPHYCVVEAGNGQEALELMNQERPKVILSDLMMPVMDGVAFIKALRSDARTRHIPFIILSSKGTANTPIEALENGADAYLEKPFNPRHLLARIGRLLGRDAEVIAYSKSARASIEQFAGKEMKTADRDLLKAITEVILSRLDDETLSGTDVADAVSISEMQLYRKLKSLVNMTPTEYIRHLRLDRAAHLLLSTNKNVQEIMYACGFVTKTYFFREFSKRYSMSPGEYRRSQRGR